MTTTQANREPIDASELVSTYYSACVRDEWRRLVKDSYHRLEFDTSLYFLEKYLPSNGTILDAGGGPGRYTIELARRGHNVVLLDLTQANLDFARRQIRRAGVQDKVLDICQGSIANLSRFPDDTFDGTICLGGPLSHILDAEERNRAISELIRVTRKGSPVFFSVIARLSLLIVELMLFQHEIGMPIHAKIRDTGDYEGGFGFTACHFFLPEELEADLRGKGVEILGMVGLEGISSHHARHVNKLAKDDARWKTWLETHYATCQHPAIVGISEHIMAITQKM